MAFTTKEKVFSGLSLLLFSEIIAAIGTCPHRNTCSHEALVASTILLALTAPTIVGLGVIAYKMKGRLFSEAGGRAASEESASLNNQELALAYS